MRRQWWPLAAVCFGTFMLLLDVTIVTVALPAISREFGSSFSQLQWLVDVYALVLAAFVLGSGTLADRFGHRSAYVIGLVIFAAASLACSLAPSAAFLIASRGIQGVGAAVMYATTLALIAESYEGRRRGAAFGVWGAVSGAATAIGPALGGLLTDQLSWRWIFLINLPVCAGAIALTLRGIRPSPSRPSGGLDVTGVLSFAASAAALTYGLIRANDLGWSSPQTLATFGAAVVFLLIFVINESRNPSPMLDLRLLTNPSFGSIMLVAAGMNFSAFANLNYVSLWLQSVLGLSAIQAGAVILPMSVVGIVVSIVIGRFLHTGSNRLILGIGMLIVGAGALAQAWLSAGSGWATILPGVILLGIGAGLVNPSLSSAAMAAAPPKRAGMAAGSVNTFRQLGIALGIAVLGATLHAGVRNTLSGRPDIPDAAAAAGRVAGGHADTVIKSVPADRQGTVSQLTHAAFASGLDLSFLTAAAFAVLAGVVVLICYRGGVQGNVPEQQQGAGSARGQ